MYNKVTILRRLTRLPTQTYPTIFRAISTQSNNGKEEGLVLGYYDNFELTKGIDQFDNQSKTEVENLLKLTKAKGKLGEVKTFYNVKGLPSRLALVGLGNKIDDEKVKTDRLRQAIANGVRTLKGNGAITIKLDNSLAVSEGALLSTYNYKELIKAQTNDTKEDALNLTPLLPSVETKELVENYDWASGAVYAKAQNLARYLMDSPANLMTPTKFCSHVSKLAQQLGNVEVKEHDKAWLESQKMGAFLSVTVGSAQPPRLLELNYFGGKQGEAPLSLVGKGVTFDAGGISIKPSSNMHLMKGDMGGAATVVSALLAIAELKLPINVTCAVGLCENLPSSTATKPGDVVTAANGKTIEVLNTDAEGRLVLSDTLHYVTTTYHPKSVVTVATLTGAMVVALGDIYCGAFSTSNKLWSQLEQAGKLVGDEFWRMPFHQGYKNMMTQTNVADLANIGTRSAGGSASAAAFLREFVPRKAENQEPIDMNNDDTLTTQYAHLDIAGIMESYGDAGYLVKGMSGRPVRSLIELARIHSLKQ